MHPIDFGTSEGAAVHTEAYESPWEISRTNLAGVEVTRHGVESIG